MPKEDFILLSGQADKQSEGSIRDFTDSFTELLTFFSTGFEKPAKRTWA